MTSTGQLAVQIDASIARAGLGGGDMIAVADVKSLIDELFESALAEARTENQVLIEELRELVAFIGSTKSEVMLLQPRTFGAKKIPDANLELDAIVGATDEAAGRIMDAADQIGEIAGDSDAKLAEKLQNISTELYEASSFQDICGQRITKVVKTLKFLEERLIVLAEAIGDDTVIEEEKSVEFNSDGLVEDNKSLLHGPQLEDEANSQDDIDALMADFD